MKARHIARDEFKFYCGRTNHHGVCWTSAAHYWSTPSDERNRVCLTCVDRAVDCGTRAEYYASLRAKEVAE